MEQLLLLLFRFRARLWVPVFVYIFPLDTSDQTSPVSMLGAAGLATNNGSRGLVLGGQLCFKENTYRTTTVFVRGI